MFFSNAEEMAAIQGTLYNMPPTTFDPAVGYRWNQGLRFARVAQGEIVCDHYPAINRQGYHRSFDYEEARPSDRTYRIIALGDSFTNDLACSEAWPETLHRMLRSRQEYGRDIEVYGMPTDGGGLLNWYTVLHEYILPNYELDMLIIAVWGDDLVRDWSFSHGTDSDMLWGRSGLHDRPASLDDVMARIDSIERIYKVVDNAEIDACMAELRANADPQPVKMEYGIAPREIPQGYAFSVDDFKARYSAERFDVLESIMTTCADRGIKVIYSEVPENGDVHYLLDRPGAKTYRQVRGEGIAKHFGVTWFDGCEIFTEFSAQSLIDFYWLKYDGHWNQAASTYYAMRLAERIIAEGMIR